MAFKGHDWVRYNYKNIKGYILSFENHEYLNPTFHSEFIYMGEHWSCIGEAYDCLEKDNPELSDSQKIHAMGSILYYFFKQKPILADKLISTEDFWIEPQVTNHDNFWFKCKCPNCFFEEATNYYGRLLMEIRDRLIWERKPKHKASKRWFKRYF